VVVFEDCDVEGKVEFIWFEIRIFSNIKLIEVSVDVFLETEDFVGRV
jgi:hypothetical protein